jgi:hypothetical protein
MSNGSGVILTGETFTEEDEALFGRVGGEVDEEEVDEGGDDEAFVAVSEEKDGSRVVPEEVGEERTEGVEGHHEEEADDVCVELVRG